MVTPLLQPRLFCFGVFIVAVQVVGSDSAPSCLLSDMVHGTHTLSAVRTRRIVCCIQYVGTRCAIAEGCWLYDYSRGQWQLRGKTELSGGGALTLFSRGLILAEHMANWVLHRLVLFPQYPPKCTVPHRRSQATT